MDWQSAFAPRRANIFTAVAILTMRGILQLVPKNNIISKFTAVFSGLKMMGPTVLWEEVGHFLPRRLTGASGKLLALQSYNLNM